MLFEVLSFAIAAAWVSMSTVVAERLGTRAGGVVATLPSTLVVALYFIAVEQGTGFATRVAWAVPAEMGINSVFLALFVTFSGKGLVRALAAAFAGWAALSAVLFLADPHGMVLPLLAFAGLVAASAVWLRARHPYRQEAGSHISYTPREIVLRGLFAGAVISLAIVGSRLAGPVLGAILAVFPVIFTSTMVILYLRQGPSFTGATGTTMILGSVNVVAFAVVAAFTLPALGAGWGTLAAIVASYAWSGLGYLLLTGGPTGGPAVR
jgi:hypothetical protein